MQALAQILMFVMFMTPLLTIPLTWRFFKSNKIWSLILGLLLAAIISFILYRFSFFILYEKGNR